MRFVTLIFTSIIWSVLDAADAANARFNPELREELAEMAKADQRFRQSPTSTKEEWERVDGRNLRRMKEIIATYGWPGRSLVGESGAENAWLLVQHCDSDLPFQELCLPLIEKAVAAGEAKPRHYAYFIDRVRTHQKKPQVYGTQFVDDELYPVEDPDHVDERRKSVGLGPQKEYIEHMKALIEQDRQDGKKPNKAPEPTPMSVTPRAPSSTSRAGHRRGSS